MRPARGASRTLARVWFGIPALFGRSSPLRRRRRAAAFSAIVAALVLAGVAWTLFLPDFQIRLDLAMILFGCAACIVAFSLYLFVDRRAQTGATVVVNYDFRLVQPSLPGGRYRFELVVFYEIESRGKHERQRQAHIELAFKRQEHPDLWRWCGREIARYLRAHKRVAAERYPDALILCAPPPNKRARPRGAAAQGDPAQPV